jgi:hypothetical protein
VNYVSVEVEDSKQAHKDYVLYDKKRQDLDKGRYTTRAWFMSLLYNCNMGFRWLEPVSRKNTYSTVHEQNIRSNDRSIYAYGTFLLRA